MHKGIAQSLWLEFDLRLYLGNHGNQSNDANRGSLAIPYPVVPAHRKTLSLDVK
jgi:hypothetical protein